MIYIGKHRTIINDKQGIQLPLNEFRLANSSDSTIILPSRFKRKNDVDKESYTTTTEAVGTMVAFATMQSAGPSAEKISSSTLPPELRAEDRVDLARYGIIGTPEDRDSSVIGEIFQSTSQKRVLFTGGAEDTIRLHDGDDYVIIRIKRGANNDVTFIDSETPGNYGQDRETIGTSSGNASTLFRLAKDRLIFVVEGHPRISQIEQGDLFDNFNWNVTSTTQSPTAASLNLNFSDNSRTASSVGKNEQPVLTVQIHNEVPASTSKFINASLDGFTWNELTDSSLFGSRLRLISRSQLLLKSDLHDNPATYSGPGFTYSGTPQFSLVEADGRALRVNTLGIDLGTVVDDVDGLQDPTYAYTWYRIPVQTSAHVRIVSTGLTYQLTPADNYTTIRVVIHFTDADDNLEIFSLETPTIVSIRNESRPKIALPTYVDPHSGEKKFEDGGYADDSSFVVSPGNLSIMRKIIPLSDVGRSDLIFVQITTGSGAESVRIDVPTNEDQATIAVGPGTLLVTVHQTSHLITWRYSLKQSVFDALSRFEATDFLITIADRPDDFPERRTDSLRVRISIEAIDDPPRFASSEFSGTPIRGLGGLSASDDRSLDTNNPIALGIFAPPLVDPDSPLVGTFKYRLTASTADNTNISERFTYVDEGPNQRSILMNPGSRLFGTVTLTLNAYTFNSEQLIPGISIPRVETALEFGNNNPPAIDEASSVLVDTIYAEEPESAFGILSVRITDAKDRLTLTVENSGLANYGRFRVFPNSIPDTPENTLVSIAWLYVLNAAHPLVGFADRTSDRIRVTITDEGGASTTSEIVVTIVGTNDAPIFHPTNPFSTTTQSNFALSVLSQKFENPKIGIAANATDPDKGEFPFYTLVSAINQHGQDFTARFGINPDSGELFVIGGTSINDTITLTVRASDANDPSLHAEATHTLSFQSPVEVLEGNDILAGKTSLLGTVSLFNQTTMTSDIIFQAAAGQPTGQNANTITLNEPIQIIGKYGMIRFTLFESGQLTWRYTVNDIITSNIRIFTDALDVYSILINGLVYNLTFKLTALTDDIRTAQFITITSPTTELLNDHKIKTSEKQLESVSQKHVIHGDDAADTVKNINSTGIIDLGHGVDKAYLAPTNGIDTVVYNFDARDPTGWVATDGSDTYVGFQRGTDKLILRALTTDGENPFAQPGRNSNIKINGTSENINGNDMIIGITVQFAASGGGHGNIQAGNTLTIKFATPITTEAFAGFLPAGFYDPETLEIIDIFTSGQNVFEHLFAGSSTSDETITITDNFDIVALEVPLATNNVATGSPHIENDNGRLSVTAGDISDADGIAANTTYRHSWYKFDVHTQSVVFLETADTYLLREVDIGDVIMAILNFEDTSSNSETLSTGTYHIIDNRVENNADDKANDGTNHIEIDLTNADFAISVDNELTLLPDIL